MEMTLSFWKKMRRNSLEVTVEDKQLIVVCYIPIHVSQTYLSHSCQSPSHADFPEDGEQMTYVARNIINRVNKTAYSLVLGHWFIYQNYAAAERDAF